MTWTHVRFVRFVHPLNTVETAMPKARNPVRHRMHTAAWIARNPEKRRAHHDVRNAIRQGVLKRQPCHCGARGEAHHEDYDAPLDVVWLCRKHHAERHRADYLRPSWAKR